MVMASKKEHGLKDVQRISNSGSKELGGGTTTIKFTLSLLSQRSIHSSSRRIDVVRFIRLLHRAIALLPILQILPNGLAAPLFMPPQPLVTASLTSSPTAWNGRSTGSSPPPFISSYSNARVLAACAAASASTSHRALLTAAAAAKAEESIGNVDTTANFARQPRRGKILWCRGGGARPWRAVAAAQKAERADVNGRMAEFRAP